MKSQALILSIIAALLTTSCSRGEDVNSLVRLYYIPIGVETYIPITVESIEEQGSYAELTTSDKRYHKLMSIIDKATDGSFDEGAVRAKIMTGGNAMYIDNSGGLKLPLSTKKLSSPELSVAKKLLDGILMK